MSQSNILKEYEWGDPDWNVEKIVDAWAVRQVIDESEVDDDVLALIDAGVRSESELPSDAFKRVVMAVSSTPGYDTEGLPTAEEARVIRVDVEYLTPLVDYEGNTLSKRVMGCDVYLN